MELLSALESEYKFQKDSLLHNGPKHDSKMILCESPALLSISLKSSGIYHKITPYNFSLMRPSLLISLCGVISQSSQ